MGGGGGEEVITAEDKIVWPFLNLRNSFEACERHRGGGDGGDESGNSFPPRVIYYSADDDQAGMGSNGITVTKFLLLLMFWEP